MAYDIQLRLPEGWQQEMETYLDEGGAEITHLEAHLYNEARKRDEGYIDLYVGPLPEDTTAEDQALSNYADIVGFDDDDHYEEFIRARCADDCYLLEWPDLRVSGPDNSADVVYDGTPKPAVLYTTLRPELFPETGYSTDAFPGA